MVGIGLCIYIIYMVKYVGDMCDYLIDKQILREL